MDCNVDRLNPRQQYTYDAILSSVINHKGTTFFLIGSAGTGKTFLYNIVATKCRSLGNIVVVVASSGIASMLLVGGQMAYSTFNIPLNVLENSICGFNRHSQHAKLFKETKLVIWNKCQCNTCIVSNLLTDRCKISVVIKNLLRVLLLFLVDILDKSSSFCQKEFASKLYRSHLDDQDCGKNCMIFR